jgi:hypothetical protein
MTSISKITTVARVNQVDILVIEDGDKLVAVKPICEALGVAYSSQLQKLKIDPILSSVVLLNNTTGADGKSYEMVTIPLKYVFGWLFRIDSRNVKEEVRENVLKYQTECYEVLYNRFFGSIKKQIETNEMEIAILEQINKLNEQKSEVAVLIRDKKSELETVRKQRLDNQLTLF